MKSFEGRMLAATKATALAAGLMTAVACGKPVPAEAVMPQPPAATAPKAPQACDSRESTENVYTMGWVLSDSESGFGKIDDLLGENGAAVQQENWTALGERVRKHIDKSTVLRGGKLTVRVAVGFLNENKDEAEARDESTRLSMLASQATGISPDIEVPSVYRAQETIGMLEVVERMPNEQDPTCRA